MPVVLRFLDPEVRVAARVDAPVDLRDVVPPGLDRDPEAAARLAAARAALAELSASVQVPVENLALPELVRRLCWSPPSDTSVRGVGDFLAAGGARPWQVELVAAPLSRAMKG